MIFTTIGPATSCVAFFDNTAAFSALAANILYLSRGAKSGIPGAFAPGTIFTARACSGHGSAKTGAAGCSLLSSILASRKGLATSIVEFAVTLARAAGQSGI